MDPEQVGRTDEPPGTEPIASPPAVAFAASLAISVAALAAAAAAGPPYLNLSSLSGWIVVFAAASFASLFTVPFAANRVLTRIRPERAESWEPAMVVWGCAALFALAVGAGMVAAGSFSPTDSLADAAGLLLVIESGLVVAVLAIWILSS